MRTLLTLTCLLFCSTGFAHSGDLQPYTAEYDIKISVLGGKMQNALSQQNDHLRASSRIVATGMSRLLAKGEIQESSEFNVLYDRIMPARYESDDGLSKDGQSVRLNFDNTNKEVSGTIDNTAYSAELKTDIQDRVSLQYAVMQDLLHDSLNDTYYMQDADEIKTLNVTRGETQSVKVPFGTFEAVAIRHQAENSSRITTLWCAEELGWLPVMIEQHRKGKLRVRARLTEYSAD